MESKRGIQVEHGIEFFINGVKHNVSGELLATTSLNDYIRDEAGLKGTKVMCREAGCGCCAVTVTYATDGNKADTMSINSCTCPLYSVDGWQISTVEGIGNHLDGFHPIQDRIAKYNGTQCGYCTPGFVMSMYGLLHQNPKVTQQDIEDSFDGHICRCTGYRSILDAMKTFGSDSNAQEKTLDIEDLNKHLCPRTGEICNSKDGGCTDNGVLPRNLELLIKNTKWFRPLNLEDLRRVLEQHQSQSVWMFFGNTSTGIFKHQEPYEVYIDLRAVNELHQFKENEKSITIGAGTTLTKFISYLKIIQNKPGYQYSQGVIRHLKVVASVLVRNAGCIAGNLMIKHSHQEFPSDIYTTMEAIGAKLNIFDSKNSWTSKVGLVEFLKDVNMKGKVIISLELPMWNVNDSYRSYKITPRWQNAHAYVNAAFKFPVENRKITNVPSIVFGGISPQTVHAVKTEQFLNGKELTNETIAEALRVLSSELDPKTEPLVASPKYRLQLATNLLYKTLLDIYKPTQYKLQSGGDSMDRPLSFGMQTYQEKTDEFPIKEPLPKKTARFQASGEAEYINDIPTMRRELAAAMVISSISCGTIENIDTSQALAIPGVVRFVGVSDIPEGGVNKSLPDNPIIGELNYDLFADKEIEFGGQLIGLILAESAALAEEGARKVKVTYHNVQTPVLDLEDAIAKNTVFEECTKEKIVGNPTEALENSSFVVEGEIKEGTQTHFYMENQVALAIPGEDGMDIYSATQWPSWTQHGVSGVLGKHMNYVNMYVPRLGGSFGGKMLQSPQIAGAAAVASVVTRRPVRLNIDLSTNMKYASKRFPILVKYKAGCDSQGKMQAMDVTIYVDSGFKPTLACEELVGMVDQGYHIPNCKVRVLQMKTHKPISAPCRAPGSLPGSLIIESVMEHLAKQMGKHPIMFKELNLVETGQFDIEGREIKNSTMKIVWQRLKQTAQVDARIEDVERFNNNNLWRKRGISMCSVKYHIGHTPMGMPTQVSIFAGDGTVTVMTAGVEMGQGLYTKVAQAVAKSLDVPLEKVKVRPTQCNVLPNGVFTGGSFGSEMSVASALHACSKINERLQPLREKMSEADWVSLLNAAVFSNIPLYENTQARQPDGPPAYFVFMSGVTETEVDILTGEFQVKRVDIMGDFGESLNPTIDVGQVEGAFVMGLGAFLSEDMYYDQNNGMVLNDGTWEYKPPTTKDIPIDWRVHFLPDSPNKVGVLGSKATGEPSIGLSVGALLAIKAGIEDAREELTNERIFIPVEAPFTVEKAQQGSNITLDHLTVEQ